MADLKTISGNYFVGMTRAQAQDKKEFDRIDNLDGKKDGTLSCSGHFLYIIVGFPTQKRKKKKGGGNERRSIKRDNGVEEGREKKP